MQDLILVLFSQIVTKALSLKPMLITITEKAKCKTDIPKMLGCQLTNKVNNSHMTRGLCPLARIISAPASTPMIHKITNRQKAINAYRPLHPDIRDLRHWLIPVDWKPFLFLDSPIPQVLTEASLIKTSNKFSPLGLTN